MRCIKVILAVVAAVATMMAMAAPAMAQDVSFGDGDDIDFGDGSGDLIIIGGDDGFGLEGPAVEQSFGESGIVSGAAEPSSSCC
jgi:hypothetical protein